MSRSVIGWREWVGLPELGLPYVKAKIDTGARTSALHAFEVSPYQENGILMVHFGIHPLQKRTDIEVFCKARVTDQRVVSDSGGHREKRYVITTPLKIGNEIWPIECTLTNRDSMQFRLLLGRTALSHKFHIEPDSSYQLGKQKKSELVNAYRGKQ